MIKSYLLGVDGKRKVDVPLPELLSILAEEGNLLWIDFFKPTLEEIKILSEVFKFHPLAIEDCINVNHHPKIDNFEDYLFVVLHAPDYRKGPEKVRTTEVDFFLGKNYLVSYHQQPLKIIQIMQDKCEKGADSVMGKGADFLMYEIIDLITENYLPILDRVDERIESSINPHLQHPSPHVLEEIFSLRKGLIYLRRVIGPQRDTINRLTREDFHHIMPRTRIYFRDVYDRLIRVFDLIETYKDVIFGAQEAYISALNQKTNDIIKILTVVSTILMPLNFIASIYGMNFDFMPELRSKWGYPLILGVMILMTGFMVYFMKKKKWF